MNPPSSPYRTTRGCFPVKLFSRFFLSVNWEGSFHVYFVATDRRNPNTFRMFEIVQISGFPCLENIR